MILKIEKSDLMESLNIVSKAVPTRTTMQILECIVIKTVDGIIKLMANDMELGIETIVNGEIIEEGNIAVSSRKFIEIIRKLPNNQITISVDKNNSIQIKYAKTAKSVVSLQGLSTEEFPNPPTIEKDKKVTISQFTLKEMIRQTIFSISKNENNVIMTGEYLEINGNKLRIIAIDGHRIAIRKVTLSENQGNMSAIIPGKTLNEISKILSTELEDKIDIYFSEKHIVFEFGNTVVISRLINDNFIKVDQMFSNDYETKITLNRREFLEKLDITSTIITESEKKPLILNIIDGNMELKAKTQVANMDDEIEIEKEGKDILIGFNPYLLMDAIRVIEDENLDIYLFNTKAPCFIKDKEESYIYIILPINFSPDDIG